MDRPVNGRLSIGGRHNERLAYTGSAGELCVDSLRACDYDVRRPVEHSLR